MMDREDIRRQAREALAPHRTELEFEFGGDGALETAIDTMVEGIATMDIITELARTKAEEATDLMNGNSSMVAAIGMIHMQMLEASGADLRRGAKDARLTLGAIVSLVLAALEMRGEK